MGCENCNGCETEPFWLEAGKSINIHFHTEDHILRVLEGGPVILHAFESAPEGETLYAGMNRKVGMSEKHSVTALSRAKVWCDFEGKKAELRYA